MSLKFNALRSIDFIGGFCSRQIPLSPRAERQIELKPLKSYDFKGFFFIHPSKYSLIREPKGINSVTINNLYFG